MGVKRDKYRKGMHMIGEGFPVHVALTRAERNAQPPVPSTSSDLLKEKMEKLHIQIEALKNKFCS